MRPRTVKVQEENIRENLFGSGLDNNLDMIPKAQAKKAKFSGTTAN